MTDILFDIQDQNGVKRGLTMSQCLEMYGEINIRQALRKQSSKLFIAVAGIKLLPVDVAEQERREA